MINDANNELAFLTSEQLTQFENVNDIEDGFADCLSVEEEIFSETEVSPLFLEVPSDYIPKNWMMDTLKNKYDLVTVKQDELIENVLSLLELHGFEDVSITINGFEYK